MSPNLSERKFLHKIDIDVLGGIVENKHGFCMDVTSSGSIVIEFLEYECRVYYNSILIGTGFFDEISMLIDLVDFFHRFDSWEDYGDFRIFLRRLSIHHGIDNYLKTLQTRGIRYAGESIYRRRK